MNGHKWSDQVWKSVAPIYSAILELPFIKELSQGTLPIEVFNRYIVQDSKYLNVYCKVLCHIASRLDDPEAVGAFLAFASDGVAVEKNLHAGYIGHFQAPMSPACSFYTDFLLAQSYEPVAVEAAAILPCFWVYNEVGKHILANSVLNGNRYAGWIRCYSDPTFDLSCARAIDICDRLAEECTEPLRQLMTKRFIEGTRLEWLFWHGAYEDLKWNF